MTAPKSSPPACAKASGVSVRSAFATVVSIGRLHIVAIAALGTLTFGWLFTSRYLWALTATCAADWFIVNLLNRIVDLKEDEANGIPGTAFVARHRAMVFVLGVSLLLGTVLLTHRAWSAITPLRLAFHALGFAYNWPILPWVGRLKALYFWKNTASATGFLITVFGYPLASIGWGRVPGSFASGISLGSVLLSAAFFFLFELSYEVIYDLRDAGGDALAGVRTWPVVHGEAAAVRIIDSLLGISSAVLITGYLTGLVPWRMVVMVLAPALQAIAYKRAYRRGITSADCVGMTWAGAGLLAAYHLWIVAGLPGVDR